jgi:hypothetical protein
MIFSKSILLHAPLQQLLCDNISPALIMPLLYDAIMSSVRSGGGAIRTGDGGRNTKEATE